MPKQPKIVTIGGGTGAPIIIRALILAGFTNISAISASTDSGGRTGIIRSDERDQIIAISDFLRNLLSLIKPKDQNKKSLKAFIDLLDFTDGRKRNLGYTLFYALLEKYQNDYLKVQNHIEKLLNIKFSGTAIPISLNSANIRYQTSLGITRHGEHLLDLLSMSKETVKDIWLHPQVPATSQALKAIETADYLIYCPGSLYGSVIANFLPQGVPQALKRSPAKKILITNLTSNRNQTHRFTPLKYYQVFKKYTQLEKPFDILIAPHFSTKQFNFKHSDIARLYKQTHSHFLGWTQKDFNKLQNKSIKILTSDIFHITPQLTRLRHDPKKLARVFKKILY